MFGSSYKSYWIYLIIESCQEQSSVTFAPRSGGVKITAVTVLLVVVVVVVVVCRPGDFQGAANSPIIVVKGFTSSGVHVL
jgi:hypothetical protein